MDYISICAHFSGCIQYAYTYVTQALVVSVRCMAGHTLHRLISVVVGTVIQTFMFLRTCPSNGRLFNTHKTVLHAFTYRLWIRVSCCGWFGKPPPYRLQREVLDCCHSFRLVSSSCWVPKNRFLKWFLEKSPLRLYSVCYTYRPQALVVTVRCNGRLYTHRLSL